MWYGIAVERVKSTMTENVQAICHKKDATECSLSESVHIHQQLMKRAAYSIYEDEFTAGI